MADNTDDKTTPQEPVAASADASPAPAPAVLPPLAAAPPVAKSSNTRAWVVGGISAVVGVVLVLGAGVIGYSIGHHDSKNHREESLTVSADRNGQQDGPMMGGQRGVDPDGDNWTGGQQGGGMMDRQQGGRPDGPMMQGPGGDMMGGQQGGPMMQGPGGGIQDFLNQLQSGKGLTSDQQQFLDELKGFVGGMRNQAG